MKSYRRGEPNITYRDGAAGFLFECFVWVDDSSEWYRCVFSSVLSVIQVQSLVPLLVLCVTQLWVSVHTGQLGVSPVHVILK